MITLIEISAVLVAAFGAGVLVGTGLTTRSIDHSFRRLAQHRHLLEERERAAASIMARLNLCLTCPGHSSWLREPVYSASDSTDDD
ncbi:MAG: hypothetical protein ACRDTG_21435 [Pseudonocardiaceae bacterium]